jgi:hypothetical protein
MVTKGNNMATEFDKSKLTELGILGGLGLYNANQARQDANTQIGNINASQAQFGPDSPYAQQLRQKLERQDAAGGRRSQYGSREVELQARLAEVNANQQSRNAPALSQLYQQRQGSTNSVGRDIASILARSGAMKGLSPMVAGLFKRRLPFDQGDERDIGLNDGYSTSMGQTDFSAGNQGYDSYDYQGDQGPYYDNYDLQSVDTGGFDLYNGVDAGSYDSYDFQDVGDVGGGFDLYSGVDAGTYDAYDFQSLPGFAKGGPVNIFDAIRQSNQKDTKGFKEVKQNTPAPAAAPLQRQMVDNSTNDRQQFGQTVSGINTASRLAGVKGGVLGAASMVPGIFTADNANDRTKATANAAIYALNPILGTALAIGQDFGGFMDATIGRILGGGPERLTRGQYRDINSLNSETKPGEKTWNLWDNGSDINRYVNEAGMAEIGNGDERYQVATKQIGNNTYAQSNVENQVIGDGSSGNGASDAFGGGHGFATGGHVQGPGTGTSDSILAKLSDGEYVNTAKTVDSLGISLFDKLEAKAKKSSPEELKKFKAGLQALF